VAFLCLPHAAVAEEGSKRVLYGGVDAGPEPAQEAEAIARLLLPQGDGAVQMLHVEELLTQGGRFAVPGVSHRVCTGESLDGTSYRALLDELYHASTELRDTSELLEAIRDAQPCLSEPVDASDLARLFFLEGVGAYGDGDETRATESFRKVFALDEAFEWDPEYPPDAQLCFANAATAVARDGLATLQVQTPAGAALWVDGRTQAVGLPFELHAGPHLVQVRAAAAAPLHGVVVELPARGSTVTFVPELDASSPTFQPSLEQLFVGLEAAGQEGFDLVLWMAPELAAYEYGTGSRSLRTRAIPSNLEALLLRAEGGPKRRPSGLPVLIGAGAALVAAGAIVTVMQHREVESIRAQVESGEMPFVHPDNPDPTDEQLANQAEYDRAVHGMRTGVALLAAGGVGLVVSIPVGVAMKNKREVTVSAFIEGPGAGDPRGGPTGFHVGLHIR